MSGIPYESSLTFGFDPITGLWQPIGALLVSGSYALDVNVVAGGGGGSGGTSSTDETPFVAGATHGTPIMGEDPTSGELLVVQLVAGTRILQIGGTVAVSGTVTTSVVHSSTVSNAGQQTINTGSASLLAANLLRTRFIVQNDGTTRIFVLFGSGTASATNYTVCLPAGGNAHDGSSAPYIDVQWQGAVQVASSANGGSVLFTENQP